MTRFPWKDFFAGFQKVLRISISSDEEAGNVGVKYGEIRHDRNYVRITNAIRIVTLEALKSIEEKNKIF